jgi:3-deoxy-manno-octulosonate cytidylyltransferase (CMP-KDO synthetase)
LPISRTEEHESIEQMRVVENGFVFTSVDVMPSLPSVNEPSEVEIIIDCLKNNQEQNLLLSEILQKF